MRTTTTIERDDMTEIEVELLHAQYQAASLERILRYVAERASAQVDVLRSVSA